MTSRERVLAALRLEPTDRTPIFEKLIKSPHTDALLGRPCAATNYHVQMQYLADGAWEELQRQTARDLVDIAQMLDYDMIRVWPCGGPPEERPVRRGPNLWRYGDYEIETLPSGWNRARSLVEEQMTPEEEERRLLAELEAGWSVEPLLETSFLLIRETRKEMAARGLDLGLCAAVYSLGPASVGPVVLRWFAERPPALELYCRRALEQELPWAGALPREGIDLVMLGGDTACDHGPIISPRAYHDYVMPVMREMSREAHAGGACTSIASDGETWALLDDFLVNAQTDGYEEIDYAAGMRIGEIHKKYDTCCLGNLDIRFVLTRGTPEEARAHMREILRDGQGEDGGHIVMSSNCLHEDVKLALYLEALAAYRQYYGLKKLDL
jgi:hypothetical protein